jgi:hypothetical protein
MKSATKTAKRKPATSPSRDSRYSMVIKPYGDVSDGTTVHFGGVTVVAPKPAPNIVKKQIIAGKRAATSLTKAVTTPGVRIQKSANMPIFRADPHDASLVVQVLNGKSTRGRFVQGKFVPVTTR